MVWVLLILGALVYFNAGRWGQVASAVGWVRDYEAGMAEAGESGRPVLLNFHATWCGVCKMMDAEVFSRQDVAEALSGWVAVEIDGDRQAGLAGRYRVEAYPTFVMLDSGGREVFRHEGYLPAGDFIKTTRAIEAAVRTTTRPGG